MALWGTQPWQLIIDTSHHLLLHPGVGVLVFQGRHRRAVCIGRRLRVGMTRTHLCYTPAFASGWTQC